MLSNQSLVCICIPCYNNESTILLTLDSILNQSYKNVIIKVFDNASTDGSLAILKAYEKQHKNIKVFQREVNIGAEANFTACIQNMEGDYSAIFHSDDIYSPGIIEEEVKALEDNDISAVFVNAKQIDVDNEVIGSQFLPPEFNGKYFFELEFEELFGLTLKYGNFLTCPSCMAKTEVFKDTIKAWNGKDFKSSADLDIWFRFSRFKKIGVINKYLMNYRLTTSSYSYRNAQLRTVRHDLFLVLDHYIKKSSKRYGHDYNLLILKDNSEIIFNKMLKKEYSIGKYKLDVFNLNNFIRAINNKRILKFYLFAFVLRVSIILGLNKNSLFQNILYKIRFRK